LLNDRDQIPNMPVTARSWVLWAIVRMTIFAVVFVVGRKVGGGGLFVRSVRQEHGDFRRPNPAPVD
jgi:hypothetical protein